MLIGQDDLVRCDAHLPSVLRVPPLSFVLSFLLISVVGENLQTGQEFLELHFPVEDDRCGDDDKMLPPYTLIACQMTQKGDSLDRFAILSAARHPKVS